MSRYLTSSEAATLLRTTPGVLANLRHFGEGPPYIKLKRKILYDAQDIEAWVGRYKVKTIDPISKKRLDQ